VRDAKSRGLSLLFPRWAISYLRGKMTQVEIRKAIGTAERPQPLGP
jgi:hypothetical protein